MKETLKVARLRIRNVLGIEELEIKPGAVTVISGGNRRGKTSVLKAIQAALGSGNDGTLLRTGEEEGEIEIGFSDGTETTTRVTDRGTKKTVRHPDFGAISKPQTYLDSLTDAVSVNPIAFLTAKPKDRAEYLLESLPLTVPEADLMEAIAEVCVPGDAANLERHALYVLDDLHAKYYAQRAVYNKAAKEKRGTVAQLGQSLPENEIPDPAEEIAKLEAEMASLQEKGRVQLSSVRGAETARKDELYRVLEADLERIDAEIRLLEQQRSEVRRVCDQKLFEVTAEAEAAVTDIKSTGREAVATIRGQIEMLRVQAAEVERQNNTRGIIRKLAAEAEEAEVNSEALSKALANLEALKGQLLESLPIKGVEVIEGEIYRNGIPFEHLSESERVGLAIEVAQLRAGKLGLCWVDGIECMDPETFAEFCRQAEASGLQFVVTRVTEGDLTVTTDTAAEADRQLVAL